MAYPTLVKQRVVYGDALAQTVVCWPDDVSYHAETGNTLVVFLASSGNPTMSIHADSGDGWEKVGQVSNGTDVSLGIFVKTVAENGYDHDDSEKDYLKIDYGADYWSAGMTMELSGAWSVTGTSTTGGAGPDPDTPSHTAPESSEYQWFSIVATKGWSCGGYNQPSGYTNPPTPYVQGKYGEATAPHVQYAYKNKTDDDEDPGAWDNDDENNWCGYTIAISTEATETTPGSAKVQMTAETPATSNKWYGIKTWDADGNITLDMTRDYFTLLYQGNVEHDEDSYVSVPEIANHDNLIAMSFSLQAADTDTLYASHVVWADTENNRFYYEPASTPGVTASDSTILLFAIG